MRRSLSVLNAVAALLVLGMNVGPMSDPSTAQMMDRPVPTDAIQQAVQAARDRSQRAATAKSESKAAAKPAAEKPVQSAKRDSTEGKKKGPELAQAPGRSSSGVPPASERRFQPDEVVVDVAASAGDAQIDALTQRFRLTRLETVNFQLGGTTLLRLRIPDRRSVPSVIRALEADTSVLFAQPNYRFTLVEAAASTGGTDQYELEKMRLAEAHQLARGGKVVVAVIDSGIDVAHPDLAGDIADSYDAIGTGVAVHKHGTAIAGGIAAHGRLTGVAPAAQILAVRAFSGSARPEDSTGTTFAIMRGMDWAVLHGARVINMSFAGPQDPGITRGITAAFAKGVVMVAAAGNKGATSPPLFPAALKQVIAVTSTDRNNELPPFANRGPHVAVAAPGVDLTLLAPDDSVQKASGTSFSAAYVSGTVALMLERNPQLSPDAVRKALMASAQRLGGKPVDQQSGGGLIDVYQAILTVAPSAASEAKPAPAASRQ